MSPASDRRVVITGLGIICPVGLSIDEAWSNILAGNSGIRPITAFDVKDFPVRFGGTIENFEVTDYVSKKDSRKMDTFIHYGVAAGIQAIRDAGLEITDDNAERIGVSVGSGIGGLPGIEKNYAAYLKGGPRKISPFFCASQHHQYDFGQSVYHVWLEGAKYSNGHSVHYGNAQYWRGGPDN